MEELVRVVVIAYVNAVLLQQVALARLCIPERTLLVLWCGLYVIVFIVLVNYVDQVKDAWSSGLYAMLVIFIIEAFAIPFVYWLVQRYEAKDAQTTTQGNNNNASFRFGAEGSLEQTVYRGLLDITTK